MATEGEHHCTFRYTMSRCLRSSPLTEKDADVWWRAVVQRQVLVSLVVTVSGCRYEDESGRGGRKTACSRDREQWSVKMRTGRTNAAYRERHKPVQLDYAIPLLFSLSRRLLSVPQSSPRSRRQRKLIRYIHRICSQFQDTSGGHVTLPLPSGFYAVSFRPRVHPHLRHW